MCTGSVRKRYSMEVIVLTLRFQPHVLRLRLRAEPVGNAQVAQHLKANVPEATIFLIAWML